MYAFFKNKYLPIAEAKMSILTHAFHYGTACFEGVRGNWNEDEGQVYIFRAQDHMERLINSAKVLRIKIRFTAEEMVNIAAEVVRKGNHKEDIYIRPVAYKSAEVVANMKAHLLEDDVMVFAFPLGNYLDPNKGIHCGTSSWRRIDDLSIPARAKINGSYVNSVLAKTEAVESGFEEAIMLNQDGHVSEGSGENIFIVKNGTLITPAPGDNILLGITRDSVITLAKQELGMETVERQLDRSELYQADEVFLTGTAAHLTPVSKIDHRAIADGKIGQVTQRLQALYFDVIRGKNKKYMQWCHPVYDKPSKSSAKSNGAAVSAVRASDRR